MPNYRRLFVPGGTYAFTVCLADRRADTLVRYIDNFRDAWRDMKTRRPVETIAACILPDHFHVIWTLPEGDFDYPARFNHLKGGFTRRLPDELKSAYKMLKLNKNSCKKLKVDVKQIRV